MRTDQRRRREVLGRQPGRQIGTRDFNPFYFDQPHDIPTLTSGVAQVSVSGRHKCVVTTSGGAKCWGENRSGQVGDGTFQVAIGINTVDPPVDVIGLTSGVAQITADVLISCTLTTSGGVKCWGKNDLGQLGNGTPVFGDPARDVAKSCSLPLTGP